MLGLLVWVMLPGCWELGEGKEGVMAMLGCLGQGSVALHCCFAVVWLGNHMSLQLCHLLAWVLKSVGFVESCTPSICCLPVP